MAALDQSWKGRVRVTARSMMNSRWSVTYLVIENYSRLRRDVGNIKIFALRLSGAESAGVRSLDLGVLCLSHSIAACVRRGSASKKMVTSTNNSCGTSVQRSRASAHAASPSSRVVEPLFSMLEFFAM